MKKNKAIVIGAGISGLICANKLAKEGLEVTLLEQHNKVGGLAQAWERKPKLSNGEKVKATFELTHVISEFLPGEHFHELYKDLGVEWDRVGSFVKSPKIASFRCPDGEFHEILNGFEESRSQLKELYPHESRNIDKYFKLLDKIHDQFPAAKHRQNSWQKTLELVLEPRCEKYAPLKSLMCLFTKPEFVKWRKHTQKEMVDEFFKDEGLKTNLSIISDYMGLPPSKASGILMCLVNLAFWKSKGPVLPAEGSYQAMHDELSRVLVEKNGGEVRLSSKVTDIYVENGEVKGVEVEQTKGEKVKYDLMADKVVIAGDMKKTLHPIKKHLPKKYVKKLEDMIMATSFLSILAIAERDKLQLGDDYNQYVSNMIVSSRDAIEIEKGRGFPDEYHIIVAFPSLLRPDAKHVTDLDGNPLDKYIRLDISMKCPPHEKWDKLKREDKKAYKQEKERYVDQMIDIIEDRFLPGLKDAMRYKLAFTSKTMERYCSVTEGAIYSFEQTPEQFPPNRMSQWTPIKGLYATGAGTLAGGVAGVIAAGEKTADIIIRENK